MNIADISTQLLYTTVPLWVQCKDGTQSFGTAFYYAVPVKEGIQVPFLVTNHHVVKNAEKALVELVISDGELPRKGDRVRVEMPGDAIIRHSSETIDLALIPVGGVFNQLQQAQKPVFFRSISPDIVPSQDVIDNLSAVEEITFIGYPSGLYDQHNVTPVVRRGITATPPWNDFQGQQAFLIDAGVFPGSSGSPVFILNQGAYSTREGLTVGNRLLFLGVLTEAILRDDKTTPKVFLGIGKVIKANALKSFAADLATKLANTVAPVA